MQSLPVTMRDHLMRTCQPLLRCPLSLLWRPKSRSGSSGSGHSGTQTLSGPRSWQISVLRRWSLVLYLGAPSVVLHLGAPSCQDRVLLCLITYSSEFGLAALWYQDREAAIAWFVKLGTAHLGLATPSPGPGSNCGRAPLGGPKLPRLQLKPRRSVTAVSF